MSNKLSAIRSTFVDHIKGSLFLCQEKNIRGYNASLKRGTGDFSLPARPTHVRSSAGFA